MSNAITCTRAVAGVVHVALAIVGLVLHLMSSYGLPVEIHNVIARWFVMGGLAFAGLSYLAHACTSCASWEVDREHYSSWTWARWFLAVAAFAVGLALPLGTSYMTWVIVLGVLALSFYLQYAQSVNAEMNELVEGEHDDSGFDIENEKSRLVATDKSGRDHSGLDPHYTSWAQATIAYLILFIFGVVLIVKTGRPLGSLPVVWFIVFMAVYLLFHIFVALLMTVLRCYGTGGWKEDWMRAFVYALSLTLLGGIAFLSTFISAAAAPAQYAYPAVV